MKAEALLSKCSDTERVMGMVAQAALVAASEEPGGIDHLDRYSPEAKALVNEKDKMVVLFGILPSGVEEDKFVTELVRNCARWFRANPNKYRGLAFSQERIVEFCGLIANSQAVLGNI